jgi:protein disulfide-isomerase
MKKIVITLVLILGSLTMQAQGSSESEQAKQLTWETNLDKAMEVSKKTKKPMLLFFTGSDWCGWCIRLQKEVLQTPEFAKWAKDNVILVELDFPRRTPQDDAIKQQNFELQQAFQVRGYPTIWFASATKKDGKVNFEQIGSTGYVAGGPSAWLAGADQILKNKKS